MPKNQAGLMPSAAVERRTSLIATHGFVSAPRADRLTAGDHHPFSPSRIVVLEKDQANDFVDDDLFLLCGQVREDVDRQLEPDRYYRCRAEKLTLLVRVADVFARYYKRPDARWAWSHGLVWRESFSSTGLGRGSGILHQFQRPPGDCLRTDGNLVDWWVFMIPSGMDFESLDELPVYFLIGHLFESWNADVRGQLKVWSLASHVMREPPPFFPTWHEFAQTDPSEAARLLNDRLFCLLEKFEPW